MSDELDLLDLAGIDQRHEPDPEFRAALQRRLAAIVEGRDPSDGSTDTWELTMLELEPAQEPPASPRRGRAARVIVVAASAAAIVAAIAVVISRDDPTAPADAPNPSVTADSPSVATTEAGFEPGPAIVLEDPSADEIALANNVRTYRPGFGPTEVTGTRNYVSLRTCNLVPEPCDGPRAWAYVVGSADSPEVHAGLLGIANELVLSALDDRFFVASEPSSSQDPQAVPAAWLIDSVTGQRGALTWQDQPTTLNSSEQALLLFPSSFQWYYLTPFDRFLPRVVDARDGTIRPLNVPEHASAELLIHQPGSNRVWIGTAPDAGHVGLAYTDDGGASWTDVELPETVRPTSEELLRTANLVSAGDIDQLWRGVDQLLQVAATGDRVAVSFAWVSAPGEAQRLFVSANAGETWDSVPFDATGNGTELFVLDERLVVALTVDPYVSRLLVSSSTSDWSRVEESPHVIARSADFSVGQRGIASLYTSGASTFSTDLSAWWSIPTLRDMG